MSLSQEFNPKTYGRSSLSAGKSQSFKGDIFANFVMKVELYKNDIFQYFDKRTNSHNKNKKLTRYSKRLEMPEKDPRNSLWDLCKNVLYEKKDEIRRVVLYWNLNKRNSINDYFPNLERKYYVKNEPLYTFTDFQLKNAKSVSEIFNYIPKEYLELPLYDSYQVSEIHLKEYISKLAHSNFAISQWQLDTIEKYYMKEVIKPFQSEHHELLEELERKLDNAAFGDNRQALVTYCKAEKKNYKDNNKVYGYLLEFYKEYDLRYLDFEQKTAPKTTEEPPTRPSTSSELPKYMKTPQKINTGGVYQKQASTIKRAEEAKRQESAEENAKFQKLKKEQSELQEKMLLEMQKEVHEGKIPEKEYKEALRKYQNSQ